MPDLAARIPPKRPGSVRFVSFNVNGVKTLKNYYPWNERPGYDRSLEFMKADVCSFQELKLQRGDIDASIANPPDYQSFISVPQAKKGYSGVGVFVRKPKPDDSDLVRQALTVQKAEEGISGYLHMRGAGKSYRDCMEDPALCDRCIGGYPTSLQDPVEGRRLDSEGRCVLVELSVGLVVISVYCPANSMATEEGEEFRLLFLQCLFERAERLEKAGKQVIIMGDINVSPDLIDNDAWITDYVDAKLVTIPDKPTDFEKVNEQEVVKFKTSTEPRRLLNSYLFDTTGFGQNTDKVLHDVTREVQGRRLKMYTVWNTLKNTRPQNIGSRIDLFLVTSGLAPAFKESDIWNFLYGSDHCPIYCDLDLDDPAATKIAAAQHYSDKCECKHMIAKNYYCVGSNRSIASFFMKRRRDEDGSTGSADNGNINNDTSDNKKLHYTSRKKVKGQAGLGEFFKKTPDSTPSSTEASTPPSTQTSQEQPPEFASSLFVADDDEPDQKPRNTISAKDFRDLLKSASSSSGAPMCKHGECCVLRTVRDSKSKNIGKKFWCCARQTRIDTWSDNATHGIDEYNCGYFKWLTK